MSNHKETVICYFPFVILLLFAIISSFLNTTFGQNNFSKPIFDFKGRYIIAVSDADMVASAYLDGQLGAIEGKDALSIIRLDGPVNDLKAVTIEASNSVTGPPSSVTVSPDGRYAIVIETRGQRPINKPNALLSDLPSGKLITVIDLLHPDHPKTAQQIQGAERPLSVAFNGNSSLVAITYASKNKGQHPLVLYQFANGKLTNPSFPIIPDYNDGDVLNEAVFHPAGNVLVLLNATKSVLSFLKINQSQNVISLTKWGNPVLVDKEPFKACFTPNGHFLVVNAMYPGSVRGSVTSIGIAIENASDSTPNHQIVSRVLAGVLPEGLAMSPDGQWIVTTNLEQSYQPFTDPKQGFFSSLTLIRLNPETGFLDRIGDFSFDGILPEAAVFDNSSKFIAVATFDHYDEKKQGGSIDFWRLTSDYFDPTRVELVKTNYSIPVTRGIHSMVIVR